MKAFIIAGGFGTRMRPLTDKVPKSLLPVLNKPFLEHQLEQLAEHGIVESTLLTGYLAADFEPFARRMEKRGITVRVSTEDQPLDTAGAVRRLLDEIDDTTLVLNGDAIVAGLDWNAAVQEHSASGATVTLVLVHLDDAAGYGLVSYDDQKNVNEFAQLAMDDAGRSGWINAGNYVLDPRALSGVPAGTPWSFEKQVFPELAARGELRAFPSEGFWLDFGTPERYLQGHFDVLDGRAQLGVVGQILRDDKTFGDGTSVRSPVLLAHAPVGPGAQVGPYACLGEGVRVGAGASVSRSVVHAEAEVGEGAVVTGSIVGRGARVEPETTVSDAVIA